MKPGKPKWAKQKPSALITEWKSWVHTCIGCRKVSGVPADADCSIVPHHRKKVSLGGDDSHTNLAPLCWQCHADFHGAEKDPKGWKHGLAEWIRSHGGGDHWKPGPSLALDDERRQERTDDFFRVPMEVYEAEDEIKPCTEAIDDARFDELADYFAEQGRALAKEGGSRGDD